MLKSLSLSFMTSYDTIIALHSVFFGLPLLAKLLGKYVILIDVGDWPSVIYYKLYYRLGPSIANIGYSFVFNIRKLLVAIVDEYYTNSFQTYYATGGKAHLLTSYINRVIKKIETSCSEVSVENKVYPSLLYIGRLDYEKGIIRARALAYHLGSTSYATRRKLKSPQWFKGVALADLVPSRAARSSVWCLVTLYYGIVAALLSLATASNYVKNYVAALKEAKTFGRSVVMNEGLTRCVPLIMPVPKLNRLERGIT